MESCPLLISDFLLYYGIQQQEESRTHRLFILYILKVFRWSLSHRRCKHTPPPILGSYKESDEGGAIHSKLGKYTNGFMQFELVDYCKVAAGGDGASRV